MRWISRAPDAHSAAPTAVRPGQSPVCAFARSGRQARDRRHPSVRAPAERARSFARHARPDRPPIPTRLAPLPGAREVASAHTWVAGDRTRCRGRVSHCVPPDPSGREGLTERGELRYPRRVLTGERDKGANKDSSTCRNMPACRPRNMHAGRGLAPADQQHPLPGTPQARCASGMRDGDALPPCAVCNAFARPLL